MTIQISVAQLRQNPTAAFDAVEHGEEVLITRNRRIVGKLVPIGEPRARVTAEQAKAVYADAPLSDDSWVSEVDTARAESTSRDPWAPG
ncbi:type II toxin-antitoxin system Phd/YefM family antitoxin [Gordonia sp. FQ]|uniref:type II toxin-antitoxin system Phd/YefM family antitoxin n=1 Tax=Gordonia sp. FQ TaxID=3446634 RepID=UPI003F875B24